MQTLNTGQFSCGQQLRFSLLCVLRPQSSSDLLDAESPAGQGVPIGPFEGDLGFTSLWARTEKTEFKGETQKHGRKYIAPVQTHM